MFLLLPNHRAFCNNDVTNSSDLLQNVSINFFLNTLSELQRFGEEKNCVIQQSQWCSNTNQKQLQPIVSCGISAWNATKWGFLIGCQQFHMMGTLLFLWSRDRVPSHMFARSAPGWRTRSSLVRNVAIRRTLFKVATDSRESIHSTRSLRWSSLSQRIRRKSVTSCWIGFRVYIRIARASSANWNEPRHSMQRDATSHSGKKYF